MKYVRLNITAEGQTEMEFANPELLLLEYPEAQDEVEQLKQIVIQFDNNPEKVNTGKYTAPSKQIIKRIPEYEGNKTTVGATLAGLEGIETQKQRCAHFCHWIEIIEKIN